jgi:DNA-binding MarR family transcriptional regulator
MMPRKKKPAVTRDHVLAQLRALVAALTSSARAVERRTGITNAQLFLLLELAGDGPMGIGDLAERARTQPSTVSIVVSRLEKAGLVTKVRVAEDRRSVLVDVTKKGREIAKHAPVPPTERLLEALEKLSPRNAAALEQGLGPLVRSLAPKVSEPPLMFEDSDGRPRRRSG